MDNSQLDEARVSFGDYVAGLLAIGPAAVRDGGNSVAMTLSALEIDGPYELELYPDEAGNMTLGISPPLYYVDVSISPVLHRMRITIEPVEHTEPDYYGERQHSLEP